MGWVFPQDALHLVQMRSLSPFLDANDLVTMVSELGKSPSRRHNTREVGLPSCSIKGAKHFEEKTRVGGRTRLRLCETMGNSTGDSPTHRQMPSVRSSSLRSWGNRGLWEHPVIVMAVLQPQLSGRRRQNRNGLIGTYRADMLNAWGLFDVDAGYEHRGLKFEAVLIPPGARAVIRDLIAPFPRSCRLRVESRVNSALGNPQCQDDAHLEVAH
jgi:hypothetical protein